MTESFSAADATAALDLRTPAAVERAAAERDRIEEKVAAFGEFRERVAAVSASDASGRGGQSGRSSAGNSAGSALAVGTGTDASDGAATVREAFRETVLPYAAADSMQEAMADELSPEVTAALSPAAGGFSTGLKRQLVSRTDQRRKECRLLADGIEGERDRVRAVAEELDEITGWLADADETPLLQLGFGQLRTRHDRLDEFRATCDRLAAERQAAIRETRSDGLTGIREAELIDHLYGEFADAHPVLADLAELDAALADCQRAVRGHLCARV
jgi:hypothetical protein